MLRPRRPLASVHGEAPPHPYVLAVGSHRLRIGPWRAGSTQGYLVPLTPPECLPDSLIRQALDQLAREGYQAVLTAALLPREKARFEFHGFVPHQQLHLLHLDVRTYRGTPVPSITTRRARARDLAAVLEIDARSFDHFWTLDSLALTEARKATPRTRFETAVDGPRITGYAITGRAGANGYLQRIGVDPAAQGQGIGRHLLHDAITWVRRRGGRLMAVNTQETNARALELYSRAGFVRQAGGLTVLRRDI